MKRCALAALLLCCASAACATVTSLRINPQRSQASFAIHTRWFSSITGHFSAVHGKVLIDDDGGARVDAWLDLSQLEMDNEHYRAELESATFFDRAHYPQIHFRSKAVPRSMLSAGGDIRGQLSMHGQTRNVRFRLLPSSCADVTAQHCLVRLRGSIARSAFGMRAHSFLLSDHVRLNLSIALDPAPKAAP